MSSGGAVAQASWASTRERGTWLMVRVLVFGIKVVPRLVTPFVPLTALYFFLCSARVRALSRDYLRRVAAAAPEAGLTPSPRNVYRHIACFARAVKDKLGAWSGRVGDAELIFDDREALERLAASGRGVLLIGSHLGNLEIIRAFVSRGELVRLNVLMHTRHAPYFTRALRLVSPASVELHEVTELDAATALKLKERIDRGEWVVISGDRVPVHGGRTVDTRFLGGIAPLPVGPYVLAALLECPVHLLFCLRRAGRNHVYCEPFAPRIHWSRAERDAVLAGLAQRFAERLEHYLRLEPLQWFNFYPFWREQ